MPKSWFEVDVDGLRKIAMRRGIAFILFELYQNAVDTDGASKVVIEFARSGNRQYEILCRDNDPHGFKRLSDAFTLFAESEKKASPTKRGRFNFGEKLVLACCDEARISSTTGTVIFHADGKRGHSHYRETEGSVFKGTLNNIVTVAQFEEACQLFHTILPPKDVHVEFNGERIMSRDPIARVDVLKLTTHIANEDGDIKQVYRDTVVDVYEVRPGEKASLYEMSVPVMETGDDYHYDVQQKVPLSMERESVPLGYLNKIRSAVLNGMHQQLTEEQTTKEWVQYATEQETTKPEAIESFVKQKYGDKAVSYDPSDPEANNRAVAAGYRVIHGPELSMSQWMAVRNAKIVKPAGQVTPSPKTGLSPAGGRPLEYLPDNKKTPGMVMVHDFCCWAFPMIYGVPVSVFWANDLGMTCSAMFGGKTITFNVRRLGYDFFKDGVTRRVLDLIIHEFGHHEAPNHLSEDYYKALSRLGAEMTELALKEPRKFKSFRMNILSTQPVTPAQSEGKEVAD